MYRRFSQPHHCIPQWLMNDRVWAAVLATTTSLRICGQMFTRGVPGQVRSTLSFRLILRGHRTICYIQERFLLRSSLSEASADFAFLAELPRAVASRPRLRETFDSCVMPLLRALQYSATPPGQGFHGVPMAVFSALSSSIAAFNILSN